MAVSKRLRFEILRRDGYRCRYCGATPAQVELRVDHVKPVSLGGSDIPENLVTACEPCNTGKSSIAPDAEIVAAVSNDALRWAAALKQAAAMRRAEATDRLLRYREFVKAWDSWKWNDMKYICPLPDLWTVSLDQFLDAGLEMADLLELIPVAMASKADIENKWKYFCGCCWRRLDDAHQAAQELIAKENRDRLSEVIDCIAVGMEVESV